MLSGCRAKPEGCRAKFSACRAKHEGCHVKPRHITTYPNTLEKMKNYDDLALAVDAACSGNPGPMEYRGVLLRRGADGTWEAVKEVFHYGPVHGTNNIGEFLAIVHALALMKQKDISMTIFSDSMTAQTWVRNRKCKTTLPRTPETEELHGLVARGEAWIRGNYPLSAPVVKWDTERLGEIPADFGRK